jgi:hypothetical protein
VKIAPGGRPPRYLRNMGTTTEQRARCARCRAPRVLRWLDGVREPCPHCGVGSVIHEVRATETIRVSDSVSAALAPGDQSHGWVRRWADIERRLPELLASHGEGLDGTAIHAAREELLDFYIRAYHLKDALRAEAPQLRLTDRKIEEAIDQDARLALLADLANLGKHMKLRKRPRSGSRPRFGEVSGVGRSGGEGWRLALVVEHAGARLDGLELAQDARDGWHSALVSWGLL